MAVQKNFCDQSSRPSVHHKSSTNQRPLNSISTAQPYDSEAKPRRNSSKKGNAEIGQRHVPASRETKPKVKNEKEKKGAYKRRRRRRREETGWSTASHSISRATTRISQTLSRRFPLTMVFPFCQPTNVRSLPSAPSIPPVPTNSLYHSVPQKGSVPLGGWNHEYESGG